LVIHSQEGKKCDMCDAQTAAWHCVQCNMNLCEAGGCNNSMHLPAGCAYLFLLADCRAASMLTCDLIFAARAVKSHERIPLTAEAKKLLEQQQQAPPGTHAFSVRFVVLPVTRRFAAADLCACAHCLCRARKARARGGGQEGGGVRACAVP
jgi:hypothetical protein